MSVGVSYRTKAEVWKPVFLWRKRQETLQVSRELFNKNWQGASNLTHRASGLALGIAQAQDALGLAPVFAIQ